MTKIKEQINNFVQRIQSVLDLKHNDQLSHKVYLRGWVSTTIETLRKQNQSQPKEVNTGIWKHFKKAADVDEDTVKRKKFEKELLNLQVYLDAKVIPAEFQFSPDLIIPTEVQEGIAVLKIYPTDFVSHFSVKCPLFKTLYIEHSSAKKLMSGSTMEVENVRFSRISPELVMKYQRVFIQEMLGRIFRNEGGICIVIQLKSLEQTSSPTYFFVQDTTIFKRFNLSFGDLVYDEINTDISVKGKSEVRVHKPSFIDLIISQLMTLCLQTVIPQYACISDDKEFTIIKYYDYKNDKNQAKTQYDKQYSGLRSGIFFFKEYLAQKDILVNQIQDSIYKFDTFNRYFTAVQMFIDIKKNDFEVSINHNNKKEMVPSLLFVEESVEVISVIFHNVLVLREWLDEVVKPVRNTVSLWQVIEQICPLLKIFNVRNIESPAEYSNILNRFDIGSFISDKVDKKSLNIFLDYYRVMSIENLTKTHLSFSSKVNVQLIFRKFLEVLDLENYKAEEAVHLIQIYTHNTSQLHTNTLPQQWNNVKVWRDVFTAIVQKKADFSFLNVSIEMAPYYLGLDPVRFGFSDYFSLLETTEETPKILLDVIDFGEHLMMKFKQVFFDRMQLFLEKCLVFRKLKIATKILQNFNIRQIGYRRMIEVLKDAQVPQQQKKMFLNVLETRHVSRFRSYKWEEIFLEILQKNEADKKYMALETFHFGKCYIEKRILNKALRRNNNDFLLETNTLMKENGSENDYMHSRERDAAKIELERATFYIEETQVPGFDYFFGKLIETLEISYIKPYTTYTKVHNTFFKLTESLPDGFPFPEAFKTYQQDFICRSVNNSVLSQAIILSLLINPSLIRFQDIILRVQKQQKYHFYIKSFGSYNSYAYTTSEPNLITKNALYLLDIMKDPISYDILVKYSKMNVSETIRDLFKKLKYFCTRMDEMQNIEGTEGEFKYKPPLLAMPFEEDFIPRFSERFQRIADIFTKAKRDNTSLSHFELLEKLSPVVGVYYQCLSEMPLNHSEKWELISNPSRSKINFVEGSLFSFFTGFSQYSIQEQDCYPNNLQKLRFVGVSQCLLKLRLEQFKNLIFQSKEEEEIVNLLMNEDGSNIEFFMRNIDLKNYEERVQNFILEAFRDLSQRYRSDKKYKAFESFYLIGCSVIKEKTLHSFGLERVVYLVLENCSNVTEEELQVLTSLQCLTYLRLQKISTLTCIASKKSLTYAFSEPLKFNVLTTLVINSCPNLVYIDIKCMGLRNVQIKRNMKLQSIFIDSRQLQKISCIYNPQLKLQNIGFYILCGADAFIDQKSCFGDMKKILFEPNMEYTKKVYQLLFYIIQHFKEIKTKTNLCVTMYKTNKMEQNSKNKFAGILSSLINRYFVGNFEIDVDMEKHTYLNFVRAFLMNKRFNKLIISENYFKEVEKEEPKSKGKEKEKEKGGLNKRFIDSLLQCLGDLHQEKKYKMLESMEFKDVQAETLEKIFEYAGVIRAEDHLSISIHKYNSHPEKYNNILYLMGNNKHIPKIKLSIHNSSVDDFLLKQLSDRLSFKLTSLEFVNCQKIVSLIDNTAEFLKCKTLSILGCQFNSFSFISSFKHLHTLEIVGCEITDFVSLLYDINSLESMRYLKLNNVFRNSIDVTEFLNHMSHSKVSVLDLSNNTFSGKDLEQIDQLLGKISIEEFILLGWTISDEFDFSNFLKHSKIKKLSIQLSKLKSVNQFLSSFASNEFLFSVTLLADQEYTNCDFSSFREIQANFSHLGEIKTNVKIPLWVQQIITEINKKNKHSRSSAIYPIDNSESFNSFNKHGIGSKNEACKIGLSLDGGGMRGLLLASELHYLTQNVKQPLHKIFDWIGGTSIGGILSLAATGTLDGKNPICTTSEMKEIFTLHGSKIFQKTKFAFFANIVGAKYPGEGIEGVLNDYFKSCKLSNVLANTNCLITGVKRNDNTVKIFNSKEAKLNVYKDFYMKDVGRATSAAPIYFPSAEIRNVESTKEYSLIDGGVGQNNPSKIVIEELRRTAMSAGDESNYFLLSLGTGKTVNKSKVIPTNAGLRNLNPIIDGIMESTSYFIEKELQTNHPGKYFRMSPILNLSLQDLELDNTAEGVLQEYQKIGQQQARNSFLLQTTGFGCYQDRSLIEWLKENTRLKYE